MDASSLERLITDGLLSAPAVQELENYCWDAADNSGDARYSGIARALAVISDVWDSHGALPQGAITSLNEVFRRHLQAVLEANTAQEGAGLARLLREEIYEVLSRPENQI